MSSPFNAIGILYHPMKPESLVLGERMVEFLREQGRTVWSGSAWDEPAALAQVAELDLLITLGGDGTILRAARVGSHYGVPILGVRLGRIGFLAEVPPEDWREPLTRMLAGDFWLEERLMLDVSVEHGEGQPRVTTISSGQLAPGTDNPRPTHWGTNHTYTALNDVVVSRGGLARLITVDTWVDHSYMTTYRADGVIVATATGCTGYALAAGGPILPPELKNILLIPICAHLSLDRPVVLAQGSTVTLRAQADYPAILTVDGQFEIALAEEDRVDVKASQDVSQFVRLQDRAYFYRTLKDRLRWKV
jgi:Predicted sugar kinase